MTAPNSFLLRGFVLSPGTDFGEMEAIPDGGVLVKDGRIASIGTADELRASNPEAEIIAMESDAFPVILPGLIDVHAHLPQYPAVARVESGLLPWLERYIFPLEKEFRTGPEIAKRIEGFFHEMLAGGTTTSMLYGAIWEDSTHLAFEIAEKLGVRCILGKVMMDEGSYGGSEVEEARELSLEQTERLCSQWHGAADGLLDYAVSPRFAVTCSAEMMKEAAEIADRHGAYLQTHLSENHREIEVVADRFPKSDDYTGVYEDCGLLGPKMVLGHCIHLSARELSALASTGSKVAHCPTSNLFLNSGLFPMDRIRAAGIPIGLSSDVAGGPELNLWQVMRSAIEIQKVRRFQDSEVPELMPAEALWLATRGGAEVLGKENLIGDLRSGSEADLTAFDLKALLPYGGGHEDLANLRAEDVLSLLIYRGHPSACLGTWVRGRRLI